MENILQNIIRKPEEPRKNWKIKEDFWAWKEACLRLKDQAAWVKEHNELRETERKGEKLRDIITEIMKLR